jgi:exopolysaccharide biosynthesis protein
LEVEVGDYQTGVILYSERCTRHAVDQKKSGLPAVHDPFTLDLAYTAQIPSLGAAPEVVKKGMYKSDAARTGVVRT